MSSDFEGYEQDFSVLTAEVTNRIGKVPKLVGDEKRKMVSTVEKQLEEARELLEQMELEVREIPPQSRGMYSSRMRSYKQEMDKLEADFGILEISFIGGWNKARTEFQEQGSRQDKTTVYRNRAGNFQEQEQGRRSSRTGIGSKAGDLSTVETRNKTSNPGAKQLQVY